MIAPPNFKKICVACGAVGSRMSKEHFWPQWLIERTGTHRTGVRFSKEKRINPKKMVVPLCLRCNLDFGRELEAPVSRIFRDIESGQGISDLEADVLIRWLWKFEGLTWRFINPEQRYSIRGSLRDRVLTPIDGFRENLCLSISLIEKINPEFGDSPLGIDSWNEHSGIFVAGVFSRIAVMVLENQFEEYIPPQFSKYRLKPLMALDRAVKFFYPKTGFLDCVEAVGVTRELALFLSHAHDMSARYRIGQAPTD